MLNTVNNVICYGIGTLGCAIVFSGLLGVDPSVSDNTKQTCKEPEASSTVCKLR